MSKEKCSECGKALENGICTDAFCRGAQGKELSKEQLKEILKLIEKK
jgi:hypothetical protein